MAEFLLHFGWSGGVCAVTGGYLTVPVNGFDGEVVLVGLFSTREDEDYLG